jgi:hypothetical protein
LVWALIFPPDARPGAKRPRRERRRHYLAQRELAIENAAFVELGATATPDQKVVAAERDALLDAIARGVLDRSRRREADNGTTELDLTAAAIATVSAELRERPRQRRRLASSRRSSSSGDPDRESDPPRPA